MKFSHKWLTTHIEGDKKPSAKDIEAMLTMRAFEVEEVSPFGEDYILDIKVLPDRSHDALSHFGMAKEIASLYGYKEVVRPVYSLKEASLIAPLLAIEDAKASPRFMGITITNVINGDSPVHIRTLLESIGQRSISAVVDATNYVLYDLGKPVHAFDADKVIGTITTRFAKKGEIVTTLDGKTVELDESILVLADDEGPLDIAGIKGGTKAEVTRNTKNVIVVSSNFNSTLIRKTSTKVGIKTDAAKRFENGITSELCEPGLLATAKLILEIAGTPESEISHTTDIYPKKEVEYKVGVGTNDINRVLGTALTDERVSGLFAQRGLSFEVRDTFDTVRKFAEEAVGKLYKRGASVLFDSPNSFDCSSLTAFLYKEAGIAIPRIAVDQYVFSHERTGEPQIGDLVFTNTGEIKTGSGTYFSQVLQKDIQESAVRFESVEWMPGTKVPDGVDHVGVYVGDGKVIHATSSAGNVVVEKLSESKVFSKGYTFRYIVEKSEKRFVVTVPFERLDIRITEDLIDEVGKLIGTADSTVTTKYENLPEGVLDTRLAVCTHVRHELVSRGFSEVMTTSFSDAGDIAIINSVDPKKNTLRNDLSTSMSSVLEKGLYNLPLLGNLDAIRAFEIGAVFKDQQESIHLVVGIASKNKKIKKQLPALLNEVRSAVHTIVGETASVEQSADDAVWFEIAIPFTGENAGMQTIERSSSVITYAPFSTYPFIVRDVAFFAPTTIDVDILEKNIRENAGPLCVKMYQFDRFEKEGDDRVSLGYRMVFQSFETTLTDSEVESPTKKVYQHLIDCGYEVR